MIVKYDSEYIRNYGGTKRPRSPIILPLGTPVQDAIDTAIHYGSLFFIISFDSNKNISKAISDDKGCNITKPLNKEHTGCLENWSLILIEPPFSDSDSFHQGQSHQFQVQCPIEVHSDVD